MKHFQLLNYIKPVCAAIRNTKRDQKTGANPIAINSTKINQVVSQI